MRLLRWLLSACWEVSWFIFKVLILSICIIYFSPSKPTDFSIYFPASSAPFFNVPSAKFERVLLKSGITLNTVQAGSSTKDSTLVLLLHGFPESALLSWHRQIELLLPYANSHNLRLVAADQRGYNTSDKPPSVSDYELKFLVQDVIDLIDHFAGENKKAVIIAHDWGGHVAWSTAILHPERIEKLIVANIPHPMVMENTLKSSLSQLEKSWYILYFQLPWIPESDLSSNDYLDASTMMAHIIAPGTISNQTAERYRAMWRSTGFSSMLNWYRAALYYTWRSPLPMRYPEKMRVKVPTLLLWGDNDVALEASMARGSIEMCDQGTLEVFPGVGHFVQHEKPESVSKAIQHFLDS